MHPNHEPILILTLFYQILVSPNSLKAYKTWISMASLCHQQLNSYDYGACWWHKQIPSAKLHKFATMVLIDLHEQYIDCRCQD